MKRKITAIVLGIFFLTALPGAVLGEDANPAKARGLQDKSMNSANLTDNGRTENDNNKNKLKIPANKEKQERVSDNRGAKGNQKTVNGDSIKSGQKLRNVEREFKDIENDWSREEVFEAAVKGFVNGYEDYTYQPNKPVTKLETVVALLNLSGSADEAENYELLDEEKDLLKKIPDWGKAYVAIALQEGIIDESELKTFNPQQGAKRYELCLYMERLLSNLENTVLEDDAQSSDDENSDGEEEFSDEEQIPVNARVATRLMLSEGIINGYPNGSFSPMRVVKRNELAVMLNRMDNNCLHNFANSLIEGEVDSIAELEDGYEITIVDENGESVVVNTNSETRIFDSGEVLENLQDICGTCEVKVLMDSEGEVILLRIYSAETDSDADNEESEEENDDTDDDDEE
jgi:hypothetical protein